MYYKLRNTVFAISVLVAAGCSTPANSQTSAAEFFRQDMNRMQASTKLAKRAIKRSRYSSKRVRKRTRQKTRLVTRCTPPVLLSFVRKYNGRLISTYRRGARVRSRHGSRPSLHSYCNRRKGAVDFHVARSKRRMVIRAARARGFGVGNYVGRRLRHLHISVGGSETYFVKR